MGGGFFESLGEAWFGLDSKHLSHDPQCRTERRRISHPARLRQCLYFLHLWRTGSHPQLEVIFDGFKPGDRFIQSLIAAILIGLAVFFGTLLLVIPGIIASVGLSMTFFIMADNPGIRATEAMRPSWAMV